MKEPGPTRSGSKRVKRWQSLTTRMMLGTVLLVVPTLLGGMWLSVQRHMAMELTQVGGDVEHVADAVLQSFEYASPPDGAAHRRHIDRALGDLELVKNVQIVAQNGSIVFSRDADEIGSTIPTTESAPCNSCHESAGSMPVQDSMTYIDGDGTPIFHQAFSIPNDTMCHACHIPDYDTLGTLLVSFDFSHAADEVRQFRVSTGVTIGLAILVLMGGITLLFRRLVTNPLALMSRGIRQVERGEFEIGPAPDRVDELGELHRAFSRMTGRLAENEAALQNKVKHGVERVEALTKRLVTINADLARLERLSTLGAVSAKVVHEVRTPLNALSLNLQLLRRMMQGHDEQLPGASELTENAAQEIERISMVLSRFMERARVPRPAWVEEDVRDLVKGVLLLLAGDAHEVGVELTYRVEENLGHLIVAADSIRQVLINLVSNGLMAMKDGGEVYVEVTRPAADRLRLEVRDQGSGISDADLGRIFEPFFTTRQGGTGLGLPVVKQILDHMGGSICVDSKPNGGTCVTVMVPIRTEGQGDAEHE